jgi:hypothetical protein
MVLPAAHSALHQAVGCMLYDERLRGRFHSLRTVRSLANQISPDGLVMKFDKIYHAFAIDDDYIEYSFDNAGLNEHIDSPAGTILALRRVNKEDKTGKYTTIGCFLSRNDVPGPEPVKQLANEDPGIRVSARGSQLFVPDEILLKFQTYVKKKVHFTADQSLASTPSLKRQQPFQQRPSSADSTKDKESKKAVPNRLLRYFNQM